MCGIVGFIGKNSAPTVLLEGLKRLEYRGYDSAGMVVHDDNAQFIRYRKMGRVENLAKALGNKHPTSSSGISHTRWATHGPVSEKNAHPHISSDGLFAVVHNGVIENYRSIKNYLHDKGYTFSSDTDSEALANLIAYHYAKEPGEGNKSVFAESVRKSLLHVQGTYGVAVMCRDCPQELVGARNGSPLILGLGDGENIIASDPMAFAMRTRNVVYLEDGEVAHVRAENFQISTITQEEVEAVVHEIEGSFEESDLGNYQYYMEKEIFEQPQALENAMRGRFSDDMSTAKFGGLNLDPKELRQMDRLLLCSCGTAWHACLIAEYLIERYARIPVEVEYASEFRYRNAPLDKNTLVMVMSQSGETIDTLAALREAKRKGYRTLAITNGVGSTIAREADGGIYQHAGPEIGVASTKAFTSQVLLSAMFALYLGRLRDLSYDDGLQMVHALKKVPEQVNELLNQADRIKSIASRFAQYEDFLFLGRQSMFPVALEGALKLKEISYIHAEGYPAAEMKHGPIALISESCPSVFVATRGEILHKTLANIEEIKARNGPVILIGPKNCSDYVEAENFISLPESHPAAEPILATIPLQILAYQITLERELDVDKPRNLAKSVTVE